MAWHVGGSCSGFREKGPGRAAADARWATLQALFRVLVSERERYVLWALLDGMLLNQSCFHSCIGIGPKIKAHCNGPVKPR
jgi:hypothetical protein